LATAKEECTAHSQEFEDFSQQFSPEQRAQWESLLLEWEKDRMKPDPYVAPNEGKNKYIFESSS
jgi:hypothetical protein